MLKVARDDKNDRAADEEKPVSPLAVLQAALIDVTRRYHVAHPVDFMVETLFKAASIPLEQNPLQCELETCGLRGAEFCTVFLNVPNEAIRKLMGWLNEAIPDISAKHLESLSTEEKFNVLTVVSVNHNADVTLNIDAVIKHIVPLMTEALIQDKHQRLKIESLRKIEAIVIVLENEKKKEDATDLTPLITLLRELMMHIQLYGFGMESAELNAQLQNINNAQHDALRERAGSKQKRGLFPSIKKVLSNMITETLLGICKVARVKILLNDNTTKRPK